MIDLGNNYFLKADSMQFILVKTAIGIKGKSKGEITESNIGYFPSIELLLKKIFKDQLFSYIDTEEINSWEELEEKWGEISDFVKEVSEKIGSVQNLKRIFEQGEE